MANPFVTTGFKLALLASTMLAILAGCGSDQAEASRIRFAAFGLQTEELAGLEITVETGPESLTIEGSQLVETADYQQLHSRWTDIESEEITVRFAMSDHNGFQLAEGQLTLEVPSDWEWEVQFHLAMLDPADTCFGCAGSQAHRLADDREQQLFVVWGGNSISDPVSY